MIDLDEGERYTRWVRLLWRGSNVVLFVLLGATAVSYYWTAGNWRAAFWCIAAGVCLLLVKAEAALSARALRLSRQWRRISQQQDAELRAARETIAKLEGLLMANGIEEGP